MDLGQQELDELRAAPVVTLEWYEVAMAAQVGLARQVQAVATGKQDVDGRSGEPGWNNHVEGACGELATAKYLKRYWSGSVNTFKTGGDVGVSTQVRTRSQCWHGLKIRDADRDGDIFVLVLGRAPIFHLRGWCYAGDVRAYLRARPDERRAWTLDPAGRGSPATFVPHSALRPMPELLAGELPAGLAEKPAGTRYRSPCQNNGCAVCGPLHAEYQKARAAKKRPADS